MANNFIEDKTVRSRQRIRRQLGDGGIVRTRKRRCASIPLGRIEVSGTIPVPAAEVVEARTVERVSKDDRDAAINCVCSVYTGVMGTGESESIT